MRLFSRAFLASMLFGGAATLSQAAELKIAILDLQRVVAQSDAGREAREAYFLRQKQYQDEINTRTAKLNKLREQIEKDVKELKQGVSIPQTTLDKDREYSTQSRELQRLLGGYQEELKVYDAELARKVFEKLAPVLEAFATKGQYDFILRAGEQVVFAARKQDITDAVIADFNKARKK